MLRLAVSLSNDAALAEDVVHDVFVLFIDQSRQFRLTGSLRSYLATCVANRARNANRGAGRRRYATLDEASSMVSTSERPDQWIVRSDELERIAAAMTQLPQSQREVIALRLQGGLKFREIAELQHVPLKTALSRYRCGLTKLRSMLNGEVSQ